MSSLDIVFDLIILTETWFSYEAGFDIPNYSKIVKPCKFSKCDGIVVYVKKSLEFLVIDHEVDNTNSLSFLLKHKDINLFCTAIYRSPSKTEADKFVEGLETFLEQLGQSYDHHMIVGDTNVNILDKNIGGLGHRYLDILHEGGFVQYLSGCTRRTPTSESCVDHMFLKSRICTMNSAIYTCSLTDHYCTLCRINFEQKKGGCSRNAVKATSKFLHSENFNKRIENISWDFVYSEKDAKKAFASFYEKLLEVANSCMSSGIKTSNKLTKIKQWITTGLIKCIRKREKMAMAVHREPFNTPLVANFKRYRNILKSAIRTSKQMFFRQKFADCGTDLKKMWQTINLATDTENNSRQLINKIVTADNRTLGASQEGEMAEEFNNYFTNIGREISDTIKNKNKNMLPRYRQSDEFRLNKSFFFKPVSEEEVSNLISKLKKNVAPGQDGLTSKAIIDNSSVISPPLTYIVNLCFQQGYFPGELRLATVLPLFKAGNRELPGNYRPISLLSCISKVFEKCVKSRIVNFLDKHNIISNHQYGFRKNIGTSDAIYNLTKTVLGHLDRGRRCLGVFLDLQKAFDTVNHDLLLAKMERIGFRGVVNKFFESYLRGGRQVVRVGEAVSGDQNVTTGVPQGSVLGPILFLIYIDGLLKLKVPHCTLYSFADDTVAIFSGTSWEKVFDVANSGMDVVKSWLDHNLLGVNISKTVAIPFSLTVVGQPPDGAHQLIIHFTDCDRSKCSCEPLKLSVSTKYLGIVVDWHLRWEHHISYLCTRIRKLIYKFVLLRSVLPLDQLRMVYLALVQSIIEYGMVGWGHCGSSLLQPLILLHKKIIKICLKKTIYYPSNLLYSEFNVLPINRIYKLSLLKFVRSHPKDFPVAPAHQHSTRRQERELLVEPRACTVAAASHAAFYGSRLYNSLPKEVSSTKQFHVFARKTKNWLAEERC